MSQETHPLAASVRELKGKKVRKLRAQGVVPAVLYGYQVVPASLQLSEKEFEATYKRVGKTTLVDLAVAEKRPVKVFVHDIQRHPVTRAVEHVDFLAVNLNRATEADVPVILIGESPAEHNGVGVLLRGAETLRVSALPANIPHQIEVSIEGLTELDQSITVADLTVDGDYSIVTYPEEMVVKVAAQQLEREVEVVEEAEEAAEGEEEAAETEGAEAEEES